MEVSILIGVQAVPDAEPNQRGLAAVIQRKALDRTSLFR